jgi:poly-gamma-glutamate synthesis protein (capsule biosynthesis protein)
VIRKPTYSISQRVRKPKNRWIVLTTLFAVIVLTLVAYTRFNKSPQIENDQPTNVLSSKEADNKKPELTSVELIAVGDMLPHETVTKSAKDSNGNYDYLSLISPELQKAFKKADLRFCNQEAPSAAELGVRGYPAFNAPAKFPTDLSSLGCNLISTGNNHASDGGQAGIDGTLKEWDSLKALAVSGTNRSQEEANQLKTFELKGIRFGFVAFSQDSNAIQPNSYSLNRLSNTKLLESQIKEMKKQVDVVIVSAHWGTEDSHTVNSLQNKYAQQISDLGADIIIGSGPHVWQAYKDLKGSGGNTTHTWFSVGNGLNSQTKVDQLFSGLALINITKSEDGKISIEKPRVLPTYMHYVWGNGIGLSDSQLLGRKNLKWSLMNEPAASDLISKRNDFETTSEAQRTKLKSYLSNDQVQVLQSY